MEAALTEPDPMGVPASYRPRPENDEVQVLIDLHAKSLSHFKADPSGTPGTKNR